MLKQGHQLWIADAVRSSGVPTIEVDGWRTRGSASFMPRGLVVHHDGFRPTVTTMSGVNLMVKGRSDLHGPLCQIWLDDDNNETAHVGDPVAYIIAAGRANHAGKGGWQSLSGNSSVVGIEARHSGSSSEQWSPAMYDAYVAISAALSAAGGWGNEMVCAHREWAPGRKPDPTGIDMPQFRLDIKNRLLGLAPPIELPAVDAAALRDSQNRSLAQLLVTGYDRDGGPHKLPTLRSGSTGDWVRVCQGTANYATGEAIAVDGVYGPRTKDQIERIQRISKISADGICGQRTWQVLRFLVGLK